MATDPLAEQPAPLTPPECDLRDFHFMPIDIIRLFGSRFHAIANDAEWRAGVTLWLKSFHQVPAASIPADDIELTRLAELGRDIRAWEDVREVALHGWVKCADGRLYHPIVAEKALEAWEKKEKYRERSKKANAKRWGRNPDENQPPTRDGGDTEQQDHTGIDRRGRLEASKKETNKESKGRPSASQVTVTGTGTVNPTDKSVGEGAAKRGTRLPPDFAMPEDWIAWAVGEGVARATADFEAAKFVDYWSAKSGREATKVDWLATWRNWIRRDHPPAQSTSARRPTEIVHIPGGGTPLSSPC